MVFDYAFPIRLMKPNKYRITTHQNRAFDQHAVRGKQGNLLLLAHQKEPVLERT